MTDTQGPRRARKRSAGSAAKDLASRPTAAAILFAAVAVGFVGWYFAGASETAKTWIPNVGVAAAGLALGVTLLPWLVRLEVARRQASLVDPAVAHIQSEWVTFVQSIALDYALTHSNPRPLPVDALDVIELWLDEQDTADLPHPDALTAPDGTLRDAGLEFVEQIDQYDAPHRYPLEPDLVAAIRDLHGAARSARFWLNRKTPPGMPEEIAAMADPERRSYRALVAGARAFGTVFLRRRHAPPQVFELDVEQMDEWAGMLRAEGETIRRDIGDELDRD